MERTNMMMIRDLWNGFNPKTFGILDESEAEQIRTELKIAGRGITDLRNLRDMAVMYHGSYGGAMDFTSMDKLSAITHVIDMEIWDLGGEV